MAREADAGRGPVARRAQQPQQRPSGEVEHRRSRFGFVHESWAELKKVDWPGQNQVIQGTVVVLIACLVVGAFLYVNDLVWKRVVENVLLGQ
jgi:preprotein translocase SecE subunit